MNSPQELIRRKALLLRICEAMATPEDETPVAPFSIEHLLLLVKELWGAAVAG